MATGTQIDRKERKAQLSASAESYLANIQGQLGEFRHIGKTALGVGGIVLAGYLLTNILLPKESRDSESDNYEDNEDESIVFATLKGIAVSVLLAIVRQKIMQLIEHINEQDASTDIK